MTVDGLSGLLAPPATADGLSSDGSWESVCQGFDLPRLITTASLSSKEDSSGPILIFLQFLSIRDVREVSRFLQHYQCTKCVYAFTMSPTNTLQGRPVHSFPFCREGTESCLPSECGLKRAMNQQCLRSQLHLTGTATAAASPIQISSPLSLPVYEYSHVRTAFSQPAGGGKISWFFDHRTSGCQQWLPGACSNGANYPVGGKLCRSQPWNWHPTKRNGTDTIRKLAQLASGWVISISFLYGSLSTKCRFHAAKVICMSRHQFRDLSPPH